MKTRSEILEALTEFVKRHGIAFLSHEEAVEFYRELTELIENLIED